MPGRDGTGPLWSGNFNRRGLGQNRGRGLGLGFECRRNFRVDGGETAESRKDILEEQKGYLQNRLESIEKQLAEL